MSTHHPRDREGITTTWKNESGELLTVHRTGRPGRILAEIAADVTRLDPSYRLVSYSTPDTILRDLQGTRMLRKHSRNRHDVPGTELKLPEPNALGKIGRLDLLHPDLMAKDHDASFRARYRRRVTP